MASLKEYAESDDEGIDDVISCYFGVKQSYFYAGNLHVILPDQSLSWHQKNLPTKAHIPMKLNDLKIP